VHVKDAQTKVTSEGRAADQVVSAHYLVPKEEYIKSRLFCLEYVKHVNAILFSNLQVYLK